MYVGVLGLAMITPSSRDVGKRLTEPVVEGRGEVVKTVGSALSKWPSCGSDRAQRRALVVMVCRKTDSRAGAGCEGTGTYSKDKDECNVLVEGVFLVCVPPLRCFMVRFPTSVLPD